MTDGIELAVALNFILCIFLLFSTLTQHLIFGELRLIERERVVERLPVFIISLLLNLASHDNNFMLNVFLFILTLYAKVMHTILMERMDFKHMKIINDLSNVSYYGRKDVLLKYIQNPFFHWNCAFLTVNFLISKFLVYDVFQGVNSVTCLLFGFVFSIQGWECLVRFMKDMVDLYDMCAYPLYNEDEFEIEDGDQPLGAEEKVWEAKGIYTKTIDVIASGMKTVAYTIFTYLLVYHGGVSIPFSMLQGTFLSFWDTVKEFKQLLAFIEQSKRLDSQLPDASTEDLQSDNLCIICREDMYSCHDFEIKFHKSIASSHKPKKLRCSHILHMGCLKDWLERSDSCPLCRRKVFENAPSSQSAPAAAPVAQPEPQQVPEVPVQTDVTPQTTASATPGPEQERNQLPVRARRFGDFEEMLAQYRDNNHPTPTTAVETETPVPSLSSAGGEIAIPQPTAFQHITLPSNAILPPNWTILPIRTMEPNGSYEVLLSTLHSARVTMRRRAAGRDINIIDPQYNTN